LEFWLSFENLILSLMLAGHREAAL
jgi:hypothetical protein